MSRPQKNSRAGIMRLWKPKANTAKQTPEKGQPKPHSGFVPGYLRLEQRTLLSATFATLGTTELVLSDFDAGQDLDFAQQDAVVNGVSQDSFVFQVSSGSFTGNTINPLIEVESVNGGINNQLEVATAYFQGAAANADLTIDGLSAAGTTVEFNQSSGNAIFDTLELNNFSNDNRDLELTATGDVTLNNVTVFDSNPADAVAATASLDVSVVGDLNLQGQSGNLILNPNANVNLSASENISMDNNALLTSQQSINLSAANGSVNLADVTAGADLNIQAANDITQQANSEITTNTSASISSTNGNILLATSPNQTITVADQASFTADQIEIGLDGAAAGSANATNVQLGSVTLNASQAILAEDDTTTLAGDSDVDDLFISSGQSISNAAGASLASNNAQLNAVNDIVIGNQSNDSILLGDASLMAENAHLEVDGDLVINGVQPTNANGVPISTGTRLEQSLYVIANGSVEQTQGDLFAPQIGIEAAEHVHLTSVAAVNDAIAISAGGSQLLTAPNLSGILNSLSNVENGEVDATRPQAISLAHRGDLNVTNVSSITGSNSLTGFNSANGSISVFADQTISLQQDITAFSPLADPQITLWSAAGDGNNPSVFFDGGQASVTGPTNVGVVNANQVFANFLDTDGFAFEGTTQILTLNTDGTVSQDIVVEYGSPGEVGYRIGVVWDSLNQVGNPVENINLFTPSNSVASEAFEDALYQQNTVTRGLLGGNEGGRETISKIEDFTAQAVINHFDNPNVFSEVTIRNDQDINLFSGTLDTVTNTLNEDFQQVLQGVFDAPKGAVLELPVINMINMIEVKKTFDLPFNSPPPLDQSSSIFEREVAPFEDGDLRWVQVEIPIDELEMVGEEVSLKQPSKLYPAADDAAEQPFENVGENETDRIIDQIERSPKAEPGYWYRVFKAYDHRGDELFFYYYKTGEVNDTTVNSGTIDAGSPIEDAGEQEPNTDDELIIGLLRREIGPATTTGAIATAGDPTVEHADSPESYDHLSRLKRKLKRCLQ